MNDVLSLAIEALSWVELKNIRRSSALSRAAKQLAVSDEKTIAKASSLVRNVLLRKNFIDRVLDMALAPASLDDFNLGNQSFLRIFVLEAKFKSVSVEEAAELAKAGRSILGWENLLPVEEFLGRILRTDVREVLSGLNNLEKIGIQTFYPEWFVSYCVHLLGRRGALRLLTYPKTPPTYVGINTLKRIEEETLKEFSSSKVILDKVEDIPYLYRVARGAKMRPKLKRLAGDLFSFQDRSSCLAALLGAPRPSQVVLDVGIKPARTIYLAQLMSNTGKIFSTDPSPRRVEALASEAKKAGAEIIEPLVEKAGVASVVGEGVDIVLLSPVCSGTGVFWREPSLKWYVDFNRVEEAANAQWKMINEYADYVGDGGCLIYWTKSIMVEENEVLVERFLKLHPEFSLAEGRPRLGASALRGQGESQRLYPHLHGEDGSYFAKLVKHGQA